MTVLTFATAIILLEPREMAVWAALWGSVTAIVVTLYSVYQLIPRRYHRMK